MTLVTGDRSLSFATSINNSGLTQGTLNAQGILRGFASNVDKMDIFAGLALGGAYAFTRIATGAFNASKAYETSMLEIQTISQATQEDFEGMSEAILQVGLDVPQTADELAKAFYQIASAGFDGAEGVRLLDISARAAVGGVTDVETAADGITTAMNAWKLSMEDAEGVADKMFKTVELGKTTFPELSNNLSQVASIAASANIPLEEILAAVAAMTKQGIPTAQAFTQIKSAIISTNEVLGDGWTKAMTFQEGMIAVSDAAGGSQTELREMVGRVEAMNAVLALTGENAELAAQSLDEVTNSTGAAGAAFDTMVQSAENQSKLLAANIEAAFRPLGDFILKNFRDVTEFINQAFESGDIEKFAKIVGAAVSGIIAYKTATALTSISVTDMKRALVAARKAMQVLNVVTKSNPLGLLLGVLASAAAAYMLFKDNAEEASKAQKTFGDTIAEGTANVNVLFEQLKKTNKGTKTRATLIDQINKEYGKYLPNLLTEKSSLDDIKAAQDAANESLINNIALKAQNTEIGKIQQAQIKREQDAFKKLSESTKVDLGSISAAYADFLDSSTDAFGTLGSFESFFALHDKFKSAGSEEVRLIGQLSEARRNDANAIQNITDLYSIYLAKTSDRDAPVVAPPKITPTGDDKSKETLNYYQTLQKRLGDAKKALEDLSAVSNKVDTKAVKAQNEKIKGIEEQISRQEILLGLKELESPIEEKRVEQETRKVEKKKELNQLSLQELNLLRISVKEELEGLDKTSSKYKEYAELQKAVNENIAFLVADWMGNGASALGEMGNAISKMNSELGDMILFAAEFLDNVAGIIDGLASGNLLQAAASVVKLTVQLFNGERRRQLQQERTTREIERQNFELEKQLKLLERSIGTDTVNEFRKAFAEIEESMAELERMSKQTTTNFWGKTSDKYDHQVLAQQYSDLLDKKFELEKALQETVTTTTSESISDSILDGFAEGKFAAADFAETFEDLMKNAMLESFKVKYLEKAFDDFYNSFAEAAESGGGLSASELENLQNQFNTDIENAQAGFDAINTLFEDAFGSSIADVVTDTEETAEEVAETQGLAGSIQASLTEETGTILAGTMNSMRVFIEAQNDILNNMEQHLSNIVVNTEYNKQLDRLENIEALLSEQTQSLRSTGG